MSPDRLSRVFAALADPTRREILAQLSTGTRSVTELAQPHDMSLPAISKHLRVLERSGLIERARDAQWRPCKLQAAPLKEATAWMEQYRRFWEESFDRLEDYLQELQSKKKEPHARETKTGEKAAPNKLTLRRVFAAPRSLVFAAWTQAEHMKQWSAPKGFTIPVSEGDLRPSGAWRACMVTPDGHKLWLGGHYTKIVPDKLLVFTHQWEGEGGPETVVTVRFSDAKGGGTLLKFEQTGFDSKGSRDGHAGGWQECFDRLVAVLVQLQAAAGARGVKQGAAQSADSRVIVSTRLVPAVPAKVYAVFADPEQLVRWWGPNGFTNTIKQFELRPGGVWRIVMHSPTGTDYANESRFIDVVPAERIVLQHLKPMHHYDMVMTFEARGKKTLLTWRMAFTSLGEDNQLRAFLEQANQQNFDRLEACLRGENPSARVKPAAAKKPAKPTAA